MNLVAAKCPNCNGRLQVDASKDAAICQYCNNAYIVKDAIKNYNTYVTNNVVTKSVNIIQESEYDRMRQQALYLEKTRGYSAALDEWQGLSVKYGYKMTDDDYKHLKMCANRFKIERQRQTIERLTDTIVEQSKSLIEFAEKGWDPSGYNFKGHLEDARKELQSVEPSAFNPGERDRLFKMIDDAYRKESQALSQRKKRNKIFNPIYFFVDFVREFAIIFIFLILLAIYCYS